jgi:hypothetical protein
LFQGALRATARTRFVGVVHDALIEAVFVLQAGIAADGTEKARSKRRIDTLEGFQKDETN